MICRVLFRVGGRLAGIFAGPLNGYIKVEPPDACDGLLFCNGLPFFQTDTRLSYRYRRPARKQSRQLH